MVNLSLTGICPICDANIKMAEDTTESEVLSCPECKTRLVVDEVKDGNVSLSEAPEVEEDWGE